MDLSATIHLLGNVLGKVISELESPAIFELEEQIRKAAKARRAGDAAGAQILAKEVASLSNDQARAVASAFSLYFDLVNLAEENYRVSVLRDQEKDAEIVPVHDSIDEAVIRLKESGFTGEQMAALLNRLDIELVLTAHPTEAKRRTLLSKLHRITQILRALDHPDLLKREEDALLTGLHAEVTAFWLTDRSRTQRPAATDEVRTGLYFIDEVFWEVIPRIYEELEVALSRHYPGMTVDHSWLRLASWIGGDRDGNPNVTHFVTAETLRLHRGLAVEKLRRGFQELSRRVSLSSRRVQLPGELLTWLDERHPLPPHVAYLEERYSNEPFRLAFSLLAADLADASKENMTARLLSDDRHQAHIRLDDLRTPLEVIQKAVPPPLAEGELKTMQRQLDIFGLWGARLDLREDSSKLNAALGEILRALNIHLSYESADNAERVRLLTQLLAQEKPDLASHPGVTQDTEETWALFQLLARARELYGPDLLGPFIVSMTHGAADILVVLLLACWTGRTCVDGLQIVPLFETMSDLRSAPQILVELFQLPAYREHLETCRGNQVVMIGYSDSNKDGGYLAANWGLYQAQEEIARVCRAHGVDLTLFHGRGGTVARGGGPANRAIRAQPPDSINGHFRVTEQGEVIASRYANDELAHRHLEQIVNAVLLSSVPAANGREKKLPASWRTALDTMAGAAYSAYRSLVYETPGFLDFWQAVTPIDEIDRLYIGSRPAARQGNGDKIKKIRAIPWVFSWMQSRFNLPGWFGLGTGLSASASLPLSLMQEMYVKWPFFRALLDNAEMSLLKADLGIARLYVDLVPDRPFAERIFSIISAEYQRTQDALLAITGHENLLDEDPVIQRAVHLRNPYIDPLNYIQVEMLRRLRALPDLEGQEAEALREVVVLTINGIASGLKNTG